MFFTQFTERDVSIPGGNSDRLHQAAVRQRGIKKWLSLKVNVAHQHVENNSSSPELFKDRRSLGISPCVSAGSASDEQDSCSGSSQYSNKNRKRRSALPIQQGARNRLSVLGPTRRLHRKESAYIKEVPVDLDALPAILEFDYDSPIPSPETAPAVAPPPTIDHRTDTRDEISDNSDSSNGDRENKEFALKPRPPLRKRSLIYAMYCTAQPDRSPVLSEAALPGAGTCMQQPTQPWLRDSRSITSENNGSTTFLSCRSMPSINSSQESVCDTSNKSVQYFQNQPDSDMSIGFMLVDAPAHLAAVRRQQRRHSNACSTVSSEGTMTSVRSSRSGSSSSNISCAEHQVVEAAAYRCNNRYAPRLSTIERAQDGRLLLKSNDTAPISHHACDTNNKNVSDVKADMWHTSQELYSKQIEASDNADKQSQIVQCASLEEFSPAPQDFPRRRAVNSLLLHVEELSEVTMNLYSDEHQADVRFHEFLDENADSGDCIDALDVPPTDKRPFSIITPPDSPDKSNVTTANTSMDTAVSTSANAESNPTSAKSSGKGFCDEKTAKETAQLVQINTATRASPALEEYELHKPMASTDNVCILETTAHVNNNVGMVSHTANSVDSHSIPRSVSLSAPPPVRFCKPHAKEPSYDYAGQLTDSTCGESCVISDASDTIDSDLPSLPDFAYTQRGLASQQLRQSLLFGNSCIPNVPIRTMESRNALMSPRVNSQNILPDRDIIQIRSADMEDIPLADIAMLVPTAECFQQTVSQIEATTTSPVRFQQVLAPSKTRKLATALAKAAQLDGIRSIHRKIRSDGPRRSRGSSKASECSTCSIQCVASEVKPPLPPFPKQSSKKEFRFNELVAVYETWNRDEYDRRGMPSAKLDSELIEKIKHELNEYKAYEMCVHESARKNTHFIC